MKKGVNESIDGNNFQWFEHIEREENSNIIKIIYEEVVQWDDCE